MEKLIKIIAEAIRVDESIVLKSMDDIKTLKLDSLDMAVIFCNIENNFKIEMDVARVEKCNSVNELNDYINELQKTNSNLLITK